MKKLEKTLFYIVRGSAIFLPLIVVAGIWSGGAAAFAGFALVFGFYFLVELILWGTGLGVNTTKENEFEMVHPDRLTIMEKYGVEAYTAMQLIAVPTGVFLLSRSNGGLLELIGGILSIGVMAGSVGGLAAHEFIHRQSPVESRLGIALYGVVGYAHFYLSHLYGHHRYVGVHDDWSTSRLGETSYEFFARAFFTGYVGAWKIDSIRIRKLGLPFYHHFMVKVSLWTAFAYGLVFFTLGLKGVLIYAVVSVVTVTLLEMVNYLSHYALTREQDSKGKLEPIQNKHSWESANKVTNWFIFNAGKHCHHHTDPFARHDQLRMADEKEYLPFGLPLMTLIAFVPPLYFWVMGRLIARVNGKAVSAPGKLRFNGSTARAQ